MTNEQKLETLFKFTNGDPNDDRTKTELIEHVLKHAEKKIDFLEDIYIKQRSQYSEEFTDAAHKERQELCKWTSYLHTQLKQN